MRVHTCMSEVTTGMPTSSSLRSLPVMIISIYPHFLLYTNINIMLSNIAILFLLSLLSIFLVCFIVYLVLECSRNIWTYGLNPMYKYS
jgi:hypothetical protein